jgi:3-oxoisoapionate decarboxylase
MRPRIGFDHYTIAHRGFTARQTMEFAQAHGFDGVQFLDPTQIDSKLDPGALRGFGEWALALSLYVEVGLSSPNPARRARELGRPVEPAELARELEPQVEAVALLGCRHARAYVGDRHDRFRTDTPWKAQVAATVEVIKRLGDQLQGLGLKIAIETHADLTGDELLELLGELDPEIAGVMLDTGNLVMRLDDPVETARLLAPRVLGTHVKDAVLAFTPRGLCWQARPVGSGIVPLPDILADVIHANPGIALSIELHPRTYDLPIYDRKWLGLFPGLKPESLAAVIRLAALCETRYADLSLPRPEAIEAIPWANRDLDWLASSLGYLRSVVPTLAGI